jgi:hypothetical protein
MIQKSCLELSLSERCRAYVVAFYRILAAVSNDPDFRRTSVYELLKNPNLTNSMEQSPSFLGPEAGYPGRSFPFFSSMPLHMLCQYLKVDSGHLLPQHSESSCHLTLCVICAVEEVLLNKLRSNSDLFRGQLQSLVVIFIGLG